MKFTTLNYKHEDYTINHELIVGTHIGSLKRINVSKENPYAQENLQEIKSLTKDSVIHALNFGNSNHNEILIGRENTKAQIYDLESKQFINSVEFTTQPIIGICRYDDDHIVIGSRVGNIEIKQLSAENSNPIIIEAGDNLSAMRQCDFEHKLIGTGGKGRQNNLKIFNLETRQKIFSSKNLPNDELQLEVPIWDTDLWFLSSNTVTTCSRYGYLRLYDIRAQRRPVKKFADELMNFSCMVAKENDVYLGTIKGQLKCFDLRSLKTFKHTYKGCTGGVSDLTLDEENGDYLISTSLDRYVRVHDTESCTMLYQCYVKTKATQVLVRTLEESENDEEKDTAAMNQENETVEENDSDDEYNQIFKNMEKVTEKKADKRNSETQSKVKIKRKKA